MNIININPALININDQLGLIVDNGQVDLTNNGDLFTQILQTQLPPPLMNEVQDDSFIISEDSLSISNEVSKNIKDTAEDNIPDPSVMIVATPLVQSKIEQVANNYIDILPCNYQVNSREDTVVTDHSSSSNELPKENHDHLKHLGVGKGSFLEARQDLTDYYKNADQALKAENLPIMENEDIAYNNSLKDFAYLTTTQPSKVQQITQESGQIGTNIGLTPNNPNVLSSLTPASISLAVENSEDNYTRLKQNINTEFPHNKLNILSTDVNIVLSNNLIDGNESREVGQTDTPMIEAQNMTETQGEASNLGGENQQQNFSETATSHEMFNSHLFQEDAKNIGPDNIREKFTLEDGVKDLYSSKINMNVVKITQHNNVTQKITLQLYPEELGALEIRMNLNSANNQHNNMVHISVEHPHTLELLKQDIGILEHNLNKLGILPESGSINLSLEQGDSGSYKQHSQHQESFDDKWPYKTVSYEQKIENITYIDSKNSNRQLDITI